MKRRLANVGRFGMIAVLLLAWAGAGRAQDMATASWAQQDGGVAMNNGLRAISGGLDGVVTPVVRGGKPCLATKQDLDPSSTAIYIYFGVDKAAALAAHHPLYVTVAYYDESMQDSLTLEYDSDQGSDVPAFYRVAEQQVGGMRLGRGRWETAVFELDHPAFQHRQNNAADFRIDGHGLYLGAVTLAAVKPADWDARVAHPLEGIQPASQIHPGTEFTLGGWDIYAPQYAAAALRGFTSDTGMFRYLGATSHEEYVRWSLCEPEPGHFDWSAFDGFVQEYKRTGIKWLPLLIAGPVHALPEWFYRKPGAQGYMCLEHHEETEIQSLWNPNFRRHVAQFYKAFFDHYRHSGVIESVMLGISGNYGEAIYPASGLAPNDWTTILHGTYHTHGGYWCGDPYAIQDFQRWVKAKYPTLAALRRAWKSPRLASYAAVHPFLQADAPSDRAWVDMLDWYSGAMTDWAAYCLRLARQDFPQGEIYLCTGGSGAPEHGSNFAAQCRAAAAVHGGVRITNEGSDYAFDYTQTRWVASAAQQYGAYFSFEPGGTVDGNGDTVRLYNAAASGARGFFDYQSNVPSSPARIQNFVQQSHFLQERQPVSEIAVFYPETWIQLHADVMHLQGNVFLKELYPLRDRFDFGYMSDTQIADGGLKRIQALVIVEGAVAEAQTWQAIQNWVQRGGILIYPDSLGALKTVDGEAASLNRLLPPGAAGGAGHVFAFHGAASSTEYRDFVTRMLRQAPGLSAATHTMLAADGVEDGVYVTAIDPHDLLWLNTSDHTVTKQIGTKSTELTPNKVVPQAL